MNNKDFFTVFTEFTPSTMDLARLHLSNHAHNNNVIAIVTRNQTSGRGRGGSVWQQANLTTAENQQTAPVQYVNDLNEVVLNHQDFLPVTLIMPATRIKVPYEWVTALVSCAITDALASTETFIKSILQGLPFAAKKKLCIKWPNDIILLNHNDQNNNFRKVCGILCETSSQGNKIGDFYIGIGLNFFSTPEIEKAISFWDSLFSEEINKNDKRELNKLLKSSDFKKAVINKFCENFKKEILDYLCNERSKEQIKSIVLARSLPLGTIFSVDKGTRQGEFQGLDDNGGLILSGSRTPIIAGEISLKDKHVKKVVPTKSENKVSPIFAIDFGNTTIHTAYKCSNAKVHYSNIPYDNLISGNSSTLREMFKPLLDGFINDRKEKIDFLYTSVNTPEKTKLSIQKIKDYFKSLFPEMIFNEIKISEADIFNCVAISGNFEIGRLGADRALKFLFAADTAKLLKKNVITFSFGTAVTCEGVTENLKILENFIFPGVQMALNAINHFTALVPLFQANPLLFQANENNWDQEIYVQRGVFLSTAASVLATIEMHSPCKCFFSGGNAEAVLNIIKEMHPNKNFNIEILPNIETDVLIKYKDQLLKTYYETEASKKNIITNNIAKIKTILEEKENKSITTLTTQFNDKNISAVAQTMLKARDPKTILRNVEPKQEDFRKIGSHIENLKTEERIDAYMAVNFQFHNRETWRDRISKGEVLIEHGAHIKTREKVHLNKVKPTYKLKNYDQIWLFHPPEYEPDIIDKIDIIYDDGDVCVFAKPPNMVIHAAGIYGKNTFVNVAAKMGYENCAAVHRIDRETSGILACARKSETRNFISEAFRQGNIKKMYLAVAKGKNNLPEKFRVSLPIGEPENSLIRLKLWVNGKLPQQAETWFAKLATYEDYTLYACLPQTGRTNQIRIHLAAIGQWIVGDKMYHPNEQVFIEFYEKGYTDWVHEQTIFPRHMLHNAGIMLDEGNKASAFSDQPIICELYSDMMASEIVKNLFNKAKIPLDKNNQRDYFKHIFIELNNTNFQHYPDIQLGETV